MEANRPCAKCGQPVPFNNDANIFVGVLFGDLGACEYRYAQHLLPVTGEHPCEGSPSNAQYLEGQPPDSRESRKGHPYRPEREARYRDAYRQLLEIAPDLETGTVTTVN